MLNYLMIYISDVISLKNRPKPYSVARDNLGNERETRFLETDNNK